MLEFWTDYVWPVLVVLAQSVLLLVILLIAVAYIIYADRKIWAAVQIRRGPNVVGPWGLLQSLADGVKLFFKEAFLPQRADRWVYRAAPYLSMVPAFLAFAIVPVGGTITLFHHTTYLQLADPPVGILFLLAMSSVAVYGVMLAGWASGSSRRRSCSSSSASTSWVAPCCGPRWPPGSSTA